ncbi:MAG: alpha/beta hydrolase family protein [Bacteroidota bacterium]|nr:alpha/beta hydrolase family protein [Bacteroidota bacterium]
MNYKHLLYLFVFFQISFSQVTVVEDSLFSQSVSTTTKFYAILPDGYSKTQERYSVVYLLHGFIGDYTNWVKLTDLVKYLKEYNYIVICPDAKNSWYSNSVVLQNANYEDLIVKDVIPFVDKKYRTKQSKFSRAIVGLSMGGYGAAKFGLKYSNLFFFAGCLSPSIQFPSALEDSVVVARRTKEILNSVRETFGETRNESWSSNDVFALSQTTNPKTTPYFYLTVGSQDNILNIVNPTHAFAASLRNREIPFELHETAGGHDWKFWDKEIEIVLQRIFETGGKKRK